MPKQIIRYQCKYCETQFPTYAACLDHECQEHLHITVKTYQKWNELKETVRAASAALQWENNETRRNRLDAAVSRLAAFEHKYDIDDGVLSCTS